MPDEAYTVRASLRNAAGKLLDEVDPARDSGGEVLESIALSVDGELISEEEQGYLASGCRAVGDRTPRRMNSS